MNRIRLRRTFFCLGLIASFACAAVTTSAHAGNPTAAQGESSAATPAESCSFTGNVSVVNGTLTLTINAGGTAAMFAAAPAEKTATTRPVRGTGEVPADDQPKLMLWPDGAPGAQGSAEEDQAWVWVYLPPADKAVGTGVVVCPGGGYGHLAIGHEGHDVAQWLNSIGVAAFVLKYRLGPKYNHPAPMDDAQRAVRLVRQQASQYGVDPRRVGILGFSAGGHLASTVATHFDDARKSSDPVDQQSARPDFAVLGYPVISMSADFKHAGSQRNLLGENPDAALLKYLSNDLQVTAETPATFIIQANDDKGVPAENCVAFYLALRKAGVPAEMHIFEHGGHGFGLAADDPALGTWPDRCADWMKRQGMLGE